MELDTKRESKYIEAIVLCWSEKIDISESEAGPLLAAKKEGHVDFSTSTLGQQGHHQSDKKSLRRRSVAVNILGSLYSCLFFVRGIQKAQWV